VSDDVLQIPVAIVGGGPVGMMLALTLDALGVASVIVNAEPRPRQHPKGGTHNSRTMEHYRRLGLARELRQLGLPPDHPTDVAYVTRIHGYELQRIVMPSEREKMRTVAQAGPTDQVLEPILRVNQMQVEACASPKIARASTPRSRRSRPDDASACAGPILPAATAGRDWCGAASACTTSAISRNGRPISAGRWSRPTCARLNCSPD
jgi:hypothetical protein